MTRRAKPLYRRHLVGSFGQSNASAYGEALTAWPQREKDDVSSDYVVSDTTWRNVWDRCHRFDLGFSTVGESGISLCARVRDAGLMPAVLTYGVGGASAEDIRTTYAAIWGAMLANLQAQLVEQQSVSIVWNQGEAEALVLGADNWQSDTAASWNTIRTAIGAPTCHIYVIQLALTRTPERVGGWPYLTELRAAQAATVAADAHASLISLDNVTAMPDGVHTLRATHDREAKLIVAQMLANLGA